MTAGAPRIGLFGGSFDPVHDGHVALATGALRGLALDEVRWVPVGSPWQKARALAPAAHREAMVRLAIASEPRFRLERCELERDGPSYTIDTVLELQQREPETRWWLLLGDDQLAGFPSWHRWPELAARVTLAAAHRDGARVPQPLAALGATVVEVPMPAIPVSSTLVRERIAAGMPIDAMVPPAVASYIAEHGLYRNPLRS